MHGNVTINDGPLGGFWALKWALNDLKWYTVEVYKFLLCTDPSTVLNKTHEDVTMNDFWLAKHIFTYFRPY